MNFKFCTFRLYQRAYRLMATLNIMLFAIVPAFAQPFPPEWLAVPVTRAYSYDLSVTSVSTAPPFIENSPITVTYKLSVADFGVIGQLPEPRQGLICGLPSKDNCKSVGLLTSGRTINGTITTAARAGASSPLFIKLVSPLRCRRGIECFGTELLADASANRPVAARYWISLENFTIFHTRARSTDTILAQLTGRVEGQRSSQPDACNIQPTPPIYCTGAIRQGDHQDGTYPITGVRAGPFDLVPDIDPDLTFSYNLLNFGTPYEQEVFLKIMNGINDLAAGALSAYSASSGGGSSGSGTYGGWTGIHDFTEKINTIQAGGCDGPVAVDLVSVLNKVVAGQNDSTLDASTRAFGQWRMRSRVFDDIKSQDGCGKNSKYQVAWSITRSSWAPPLE